MVAPKPVALTQVTVGNYKGKMRPKPLIVVGDVPSTGLVIPAPPATGTVVLTSTNGVLSWEVNAA